MYPRVKKAARGAAGKPALFTAVDALRLPTRGCAAASGGPVCISCTWSEVVTVLSELLNARVRPDFSALVVTIDTPVAVYEKRDLRNGAKELLSGKLPAMLPFVISY